MAKISIHREHALGLETARIKVEDIAKQLKEKLDADYSWDGDTLNFKRAGASGHINVTDESMDLEIKLGLALTPLKGMIEKTILENLDQALDKNDPVDIG